MIMQVPLRLTARMRCSANARKAAFKWRRGRGNSKKLEKPVKGGIQGAAGLNSEGIEGFPLSFSLRCPSTPLTEGSLGLGLGLTD